MDFGGIRGQHLSDLVVQMYNEFTELTNAFQSRSDDPLDTTNTVSLIKNIPYSRKIWQGIKFGGLAVYFATAKLKSASISFSHIYIWRSLTEPPNLN